MWSPTHVQVTVQRAKNLKPKGRAATNDAFVLIQMGKEKFQTSVKEKCVDPEWYEECDLTLTRRDAEVVLTVFHRNLLGLDEFLGQVAIPLKQFESYDRPVNRWYRLKSKSGKNEEKYRGELEVCIAFVVRSYDTQSLSDFSLSKNKHRNSLKGIAASVGHKIQKLPSRTFSLRSDNFDPRARLAKLRLKRRQSLSESSNDADSTEGCEENTENSINDSDLVLDTKSVPMKPAKKFNSLYSSTLSLPQSAMITTSIKEDVSLEDGVSSKVEDMKDEHEDETVNMPDITEVIIKKPPRRTSIASTGESVKPSNHGEWTNRISSRIKDLTKSEMNLADVSRNDSPSSKEKKSTLESIKNTLRRHTLHLAEAPDFSSLRTIASSTPKKNALDLKNCESSPTKNLPDVLSDVPAEVITQYESMNHQELVILAIQQQTEIERLRDKISDMETYLDDLLLRVMETTPRLLQNPYKPVNLACSR